MSTQADTNTASQSSSNIDVNSPYIPRRPAPLVSISINHPIATAAKKIKNFLVHKQTLFSTSFTVKVTPIVAIVSLFGLVGLFGGGITTAFTFGRTVEQKFLASMPTPSPKVVVTTPTPGQIPKLVTVSLAGTIKATYQLQPTLSTPSAGSGPTAPAETTTIPSASESAETVTPLPKPTATPTPATLHYILVGRSGSITFLSSYTVHLQNYVGLRVLINGTLDSTKNTLSIAKTGDIEILQ